jgi:hypothetical protein
MKNRILIIFALSLVVTGCAVESLQLGTPRDEVIKKFGKPTAVVSLASGTRLQYSLQPEGRSAVMVDMDAEDKVVSARQVLNSADFSRVVAGKWTRQDVEHEFGRPARIDHVANWRGDILTYRWLDGGQNMLFNVYLDPNNVAQSVGQRQERPEDELRLFRFMGQRGL